MGGTKARPKRNTGHIVRTSQAELQVNMKLDVGIVNCTGLKWILNFAAKVLPPIGKIKAGVATASLKHKVIKLSINLKS